MRRYVAFFILCAAPLLGDEPPPEQIKQPTFVAADVVVMDVSNSLVWQRCSVGQSTQACEGDALRVSFRDAEKFCGNIPGGWRVPSSAELRTLFDPTRAPATAKTFTDMFPGTAMDAYWSTSTYQNIPESRMALDFSSGLMFAYGIGNQARLRCVKAMENQ